MVYSGYSCKRGVYVLSLSNFYCSSSISLHCFNFFFCFYEPLSGCFDRQVKEREQIMECLSSTVEILEEKVIAILDSRLALILSWLYFDSNGFDARSKWVKKTWGE